MQRTALSQTDIRNLFRAAFDGGKNFMTPDVIQYGQKGPWVYELSLGEGFDRRPIYGVTVLTRRGEKRHDLSVCMHSLSAAKLYIASLGKVADAKEGA